MTEGEKYYDDVLAPALMKLGKDAEAHGVNFLAVCEWEPDSTGRTLVASGKRGFGFTMAELAARCHSNVDAFWMAIQRYAREHGHSSAFLQQQGIPCKPTGDTANDT